MSATDLDEGLHRLALLVPPPPVAPEEDLARGRRRRRRRRVAVAGSAVAVLALAGGTTVSALGDRGGEAPVASPTPMTTFPTAEDPDRLLVDELLLERLHPERGVLAAVQVVLDPDAEHVRGVRGSVQDPVVRWKQPGMERAGTLEVRVVRGDAGKGWSCARQCGSYSLRGRTAEYGVTEAGVRVLAWGQPDGDAVSVHLHPDLPDDLAISQRQLEALLTLEHLDAEKGGGR